MPLTQHDAQLLRELTTPAFRRDTRERRIVRALAWLGHKVTLQFVGRPPATGVVEGVAILPQRDGCSIVLVRQGTADVLVGYHLSTVTDIAEAVTARIPTPADRRDRFQ